MKTLITLFIIIYSISIYTQSPILTYNKKTKKYLYDNKMFNFEQLSLLFEKHPPLNKKYVAIDKCIKSSTNFGLSSIGFSIISGIAFASHQPVMYCDYLCISTGKAIGFLSLTVAAAFGIAALDNFGVAQVKKKKLIEQFNSGDYSLIEYSKTEIPILSLASEGVGISIRF